RAFGECGKLAESRKLAKHPMTEAVLGQMFSSSAASATAPASINPIAAATGSCRTCIKLLARQFCTVEFALGTERHRRPHHRHHASVRAPDASRRHVASRWRSYRLASGNGGTQDSRRTIQLS